MAWGITVANSQGLTFSEGAVVDFAPHPTYQPVANVGLAFVAMSRCEGWDKQAFRNLPDFWEFRKVLQSQLFQWRGLLEKRMDYLHDQTMQLIFGHPVDVDEDVQMQSAWSERRDQRPLRQEEVDDIRGMMGARGLLSPPMYKDEPQEDRSRPKGGGGR